MKSKINEVHLLWILAARAEKRALAANRGRSWHDFTHSGGSWVWTNRQAELIDSVGLDAWLTTDAARSGADELPWWPSAIDGTAGSKKTCNCPPNRCLEQLK